MVPKQQQTLWAYPHLKYGRPYRKTLKQIKIENQIQLDYFPSLFLSDPGRHIGI